MIEPRIYRAAFLPALFALVLVAFSLQAAPKAVPQGLAADALFEGVGTASLVHDIAATLPDRRAGRPGDAAMANRVKRSFVGHGFSTTIDRFQQDGTPLVNVVGERPGSSNKEIVVMAARDAATVPDEVGSAADTAALMEFARVFEGRASTRTLVLASVDGGQLGDAGARRFADSLSQRDDVEAVVVLSDLGAPRARGPLVVGWSNEVGRGNLGIERTVTASLNEELNSVPQPEGAFAQFARLAFPIAPGAQGVLLAAGIDALRLTGSGELRPPGRGTHLDEIRYGSLGRAALRVVSALDAAPGTPDHGPGTYMQIAGQLMPMWPVRLLAFAFLLPALVTSIDAFARARRRREPVLPWLGWLGSAVLPFVAALALGLILVVVGIARDAPPAPLDPRSVTLDAGAVGSLIASVLAIALAWILGRSSVLRRASPLPDAAVPGAAVVVSLTLSLLVLVLVLSNPFAALLLVPALHLWMLATMTDVSWRGGAAMYFAGLLPLAFVALYYLLRFDLGPIAGAWYLFLLITGNQTGVFTTLALMLLAAVAGSVGAILVARARRGAPPPARRAGGRPVEPPQSIFGPGGHAGPGAIGQARSTLGR